MSKRLWAFAQYSRLIRPGAKRVNAVVVGEPSYSTSSPIQKLNSLSTSGANQADLFTSAFVNPDSSVTIHVINNSGVAICVDIRGVDTKGKLVRRYLTNEDYDFSKMSFHPMEGGSCGGDVGGMVERRSMMGLWVGDI